jgi:DUF177 domain-containing protein
VGQRTDVFDLGRLGLSSGEGRRIDLAIGVDPLELAGQRYGVTDGTAAATLDASRTSSGYSLRLRYEVRLDGPCMRCLEDARESVSIDSREVDQPGGGEDLRSPYLQEEELDVKAWARDALALALPAQIVCREDCLGLCAVCGENLNEAGEEHHHEQAPDPRWAKLSEVRFE